MSEQLEKLRESIRAIEVGGTDRQPAAADESSVRCSGIHEWFGLADARAPRWVPPLGVLLYLAQQRLSGSSGTGVVWIGRRCWPYLPSCVEHELLQRSIFIDPPDDASRLWAIDLAARCPATAVVVADGSGLDMAATRRLQLAAEAGSALVLCARPPAELKHLSAATTRWLVHCVSSGGKTPKWTVELLRCKGAQPDFWQSTRVLRSPGGNVVVGSGRRWTVEWKRAQGSVVVHTALVDRSDPASPEVRGQEIRRSA